MTSEQIVKPVVALLFAFVGGSIFALLGKLTAADRSLAGKMLSALSIFCVLGIISGVLTNQYRLLGPKSGNPAAEVSPYLRSSQVSQADIIDQKKQAGLISSDEAYAQLYKLIRESDSQAGAH